MIPPRTNHTKFAQHIYVRISQINNIDFFNIHYGISSSSLEYLLLTILTICTTSCVFNF